MTDETTVADGEARVRAMTTELLQANLPACVLAEEQWGQMARGELDEKTNCPFCTAQPIGKDCGTDHTCALTEYDGESDEDICGRVFERWRIAHSDAMGDKGSMTNTEFDVARAFALRSAPVIAAAAEMASLLGRLRAVIEDELASRTAREINDACSLEAAAAAEPEKKIWAGGWTEGDRVTWEDVPERGEGVVFGAEAKLAGYARDFDFVPIRFNDYDYGVDDNSCHTIYHDQLRRVDSEAPKSESILAGMHSAIHFRAGDEPVPQEKHCKTCVNHACSRHGTKFDPHDSDGFGFPGCWVSSAVAPLDLDPRRPGDFPCVLGLIGLETGKDFDEPTRSPRCLGHGCPLWSWLGAEGDAARPGACLLARALAGIVREIEGADSPHARSAEGTKE